MLERCLENSLKEIRFSYDLSGYPDSIYMTRYSNELIYKRHSPSFMIEAIQKPAQSFDINERPEAYSIKVRKNKFEEKEYLLQ